MAVFKCKMCGGALEIDGSESTVVCEYCGTMQTLPKLTDEKRANLYDRANHFRRNNDYDKAMGIFEQILNEDSMDAEAYWSLVLCKYGIEYVEDPRTHKRIPTCNRTQYTSIYADQDYKSALEYADSDQKKVYETEAHEIDTIQKGILEISRKEEPFDIFICYKETDKQGRRTQDSVLAQDMYYQLSNEGYRVFFSRISLEKILGTAYEPYIFAALNSAKVMIVVGTKAEYLNSVWVKNEWSRFLSFSDASNQKTLIPAYKDMDPYDLPEEFSHLQALDMSKLGFMHDLLHGIGKIIGDPRSNYDDNSNQDSGANITTLLERVDIFISSGEWSKADEYCERVLDIEPKNVKAYIGKLLAECQTSNLDDVRYYTQEDITEKACFNNILTFGDTDIQNKMKTIAEEQKEYRTRAIEDAKKWKIYAAAKEIYDRVQYASEYEKVRDMLSQIPGFEDADQIVEECNRSLEIFDNKRAEAIQRKKIEREQALADGLRAQIKRIAIPFGVINLFFAFALAVGISNGQLQVRQILVISYVVILLTVCGYMQLMCIRNSSYIIWTIRLYLVVIVIGVLMIAFKISAYAVQTVLLLFNGIYAAILWRDYKTQKDITYGNRKPNIKILLAIISACSTINNH